MPAFAYDFNTIVILLCLVLKFYSGEYFCLKATFDTTKHLSDKNIKRRRLERERHEFLHEQQEMRERTAKEEEQKRLEEEKSVFLFCVLLNYLTIVLP